MKLESIDTESAEQTAPNYTVGFPLSIEVWSTKGDQSKVSDQGRERT